MHWTMPKPAFGEDVVVGRYNASQLGAFKNAPPKLIMDIIPYWRCDSTEVSRTCRGAVYLSRSGKDGPKQLNSTFPELGPVPGLALAVQASEI